MVARASVIGRLMASDAPIIAVVGPPGYGKTTLLAQWSACKEQRSAWLSIDDRDNDPGVFLSYLAAALDRVEPFDPGLRRMLASPAIGDLVAVSRALAGAPPCVDGEPVSPWSRPRRHHAEHRCLDMIAERALHLPTGSQLALATRGDPPVPVARLRAGGDIVEVGVDELAMSIWEARGVARGCGRQTLGRRAEEVFERTEGWPAGLYLAALGRRAERR